MNSTSPTFSIDPTEATTTPQIDYRLRRCEGRSDHLQQSVIQRIGTEGSPCHLSFARLDVWMDNIFDRNAKDDIGIQV